MNANIKALSFTVGIVLLVIWAMWSVVYVFSAGESAKDLPRFIGLSIVLGPPVIVIFFIVRDHLKLVERKKR